ncbi:MAG TPA: NAD(P)H-hydrate dehydratase [Candidatus Margulisiibacteriota bacterium]|nr:NAD(P)H-hydrate dehydratase [Candidatus Margulisiibacteriota bacterium]
MRLPTQLLHRKADAHKGDFGHIFILGGTAGFSGAAVLAAEAAMRSGAGLVTLGIPESLNGPVIKIKPKEVMTLPLPETKEGGISSAAYRKIKSFADKVDILVIGPGMGQEESSQRLVRRLAEVIDKPMVIDADGLNALDGHPKVLLRARSLKRTTILTPHPGEMARLLKVSVGRLQARRKEVARGFAKDYNCIVVLKGHNTVVADWEGKLYVNDTGNPGMATAGSGDVLAGIIAAFLGQGLNGFPAAKYAVYLHGLAGDLAAKEKTQLGLVASDIIAKISQAIKKCS